MTARELLEEYGYEDVKILDNYSYDSALIGITEDNRAVYSYQKMVEWLVKEQGMEELEAIEWIDYNTIRALPYFGVDAPVVIFELKEENI